MELVMIQRHLWFILSSQVCFCLAEGDASLAVSPPQDDWPVHPYSSLHKNTCLLPWNTSFLFLETFPFAVPLYGIFSVAQLPFPRPVPWDQTSLPSNSFSAVDQEKVGLLRDKRPVQPSSTPTKDSLWSHGKTTVLMQKQIKEGTPICAWEGRW